MRDFISVLTAGHTHSPHNVAVLAVGFLLNGIERLASQTALAGDAGETLHMEHLVHSDATRPVP